MGRGGGGRSKKKEEEELRGAKRGHKEALAEGNREEEANWANVIGDIYKRRGKYIEALRWLRADYEVSVKYLPQRHLLPSCQSLGEVYLLLGRFSEALIYQKKHLQLAKESDDLVEQQRACTQLGRTYHEILLRSENDHSTIRNANKYFKYSMKLARILKENSPSQKSDFLKELIDAYNNMGMIELELDNFEEAEKLLIQGLKICDDEEVDSYDDARTRLHHNLGNVYTELRNWKKAMGHIEKDIEICRRIQHPQGEAKGFINLGELHSRIQKYDEAWTQRHVTVVTAQIPNQAVAFVSSSNRTLGVRASEPLQYPAALPLAHHPSLSLLCANTEATRLFTPARAWPMPHTERVVVLKELGKMKIITVLTESSGRTIPTFQCSTTRAIHLPALKVAKCLEDEDALIKQIHQNVETVTKAADVLEELKEDEQKLKKLVRDTCNARGTSKERTLLEQHTWLDNLIKKARMICAWKKGQALAKVNIGNVLDSCGDWAGALQAYEEGYRIAMEGDLPNKMQEKIDNLKQILNQHDTRDTASDYCSENDTEGGCASDNMLDTEDDNGQVANKYSEEPDDDATLASLVHRSRSSSKIKASKIHCSSKKVDELCDMAEDTREVLSRSGTDHSGRKRVRVLLSDDESEENPRIVQLKKASTSPVYNMSVSGIKDGFYSLQSNQTRDVPCPAEESICSFKSSSPIGHAFEGIELGASSVGKEPASKSAGSGSKFSILGSHSRRESQNNVGIQSIDTDNHFWVFRIGDHLVYLDGYPCVHEGALSIEALKVEVACVYYLQISDERRAKGLLPIIGELSYCGKVLEDVASIYCDDQLASEQKCVDVVIDAMTVATAPMPCNDKKTLSMLSILPLYLCKFSVQILYYLIQDWVPKRRLMKLYVDFCTKFSEAPNKKLLTKLYNLEVSEDEIIVSDCGLQDLSITPFLDALRSHKTIAVLDPSHNLLGNQTIERLQHIFASSSHTYGGLTLDVHCNRLGPTALFQICECAILTNRLEVLNLSGNRLTDACSSYLFTILQKCKALCSLNVEQCSITSRTVQKMADALHEGSNNPISSNAMLNLLSKLASLTRFSELSLTGIKLNKLMVDKLCLLAQSSCLSGLLLGGTSIGPQKRHLIWCCYLCADFTQICTNLSRINVLDLNPGGNSINMEGCGALRGMLVDPRCSIRSLTLDKCNLGLAGIVLIIRSLSGAVLDLSQNGLSEEAIQSLYSAWASVPRGDGMARKHVNKELVHFWVDGMRCCGLKPCCRRDLQM
ncbi:hypothetical protein BS78_01G486600 [Paspalum vaginatum]|nr:hypothetical protein BS78_01G486600 [Paspalum vaginatum]